MIIKLVRSTFVISGIIYILGTDDANDPKDLLDAIIQSSPEQKDKIMTAALKLQQESRLEGIRQGMQQGMEGKAIVIAKNMLKKGFEISTIEEVTGLSKQIIEDMNSKKTTT